jgi:ABC-2 type transport system permease protein
VTRRLLTGPSGVIARHALRGALRWAVIWGVVFGLFVLVTVEAFLRAYPTLEQRMQLARSLQPFTILLGVPRHAETAAGFTTWRVLTAVDVVGAIWGLLASTGALRGAEEDGRWELLLAGPVTRRRAAAAVLLGLCGALAAMYLVTAALVIAAGRVPGARFSTGGSLLFAAALVSGAAVFLAVGALASQIGATRGQAVAIGGGFLGVSFVIRMVADSSRGLGWLRWLSPFGWAEEVRPLRDPQVGALLPVVGFVLGTAALAVLLAGRRDLGAGILPEGQGRQGSGRWLIGPTALALWLTLPGAVGWIAALAGYGALLGFIARATVSLLTTSPALVAALGRLGVRAATLGFLGFGLFFASVLITVMAAGQVGAIRNEEATGRLDHLLVRPVSRTAWLTGRIAVVLAVIAVSGLAAGTATWLGAASRHVRVAFPDMLAAGLNAAVPGAFVLGIGVLVFGLRPRLGPIAAYGVVAWSFLVDLVGSLVRGARWLRDSSVFTHLALAPAERPDWQTAAVIVLLGLAAAALGVVAFGRRDVEYG